MACAGPCLPFDAPAIREAAGLPGGLCAVASPATDAARVEAIAGRYGWLAASLAPGPCASAIASAAMGEARAGSLAACDPAAPFPAARRALEVCPASWSPFGACVGWLDSVAPSGAGEAARALIAGPHYAAPAARPGEPCFALRPPPAPSTAELVLGVSVSLALLVALLLLCTGFYRYRWGLWPFAVGWGWGWGWGGWWGPRWGHPLLLSRAAAPAPSPRARYINLRPSRAAERG